MSTTNPAPVEFQSSILSSLPSSELDELWQSLIHVSLRPGLELHAPDEPICDVFFIESGVISVTAHCGKRPVQVGLIGREGFAGAASILVPQALGTHRATVKVRGDGYRIRSSELRSAIERLPTLKNLCFQYIVKHMLHTAQLVACHSVHTLQERLARAMLVISDNLGTEALPITHSFFALMLGVRRAGITVAANHLETLGLVSLSRGKVIVLDHEGLASRSCECYPTLRHTWQRDMILSGEVRAAAFPVAASLSG